PQPASPPLKVSHVAPEELPHGDVTHIYSDYTQEVWRVFRPSRGFQFFVAGTLLLVIAVAMFLVQNSGLSIYEVPFIKSLLQME
ncbi:MAG TPA: hypothetical protein VK978_04690, partial [Candidatus Saccharimonadales bacterium]|nr:hypothetical protein [Candidatus Saccharimonadales bacterium]